MLYRVRDLEFECRYFGGGNGAVFETKKDICEQLIDYHSVDFDMEEEEKLLKKGKINLCLEALCQFEWEVEKITCKQCGGKRLKLIEDNYIQTVKCLDCDYEEEID